jgi:hypothetical protein
VSRPGGRFPHYRAAEAAGAFGVENLLGYGPPALTHGRRPQPHQMLWHPRKNGDMRQQVAQLADAHGGNESAAIETHLNHKRPDLTGR